MDEFTNSAAGVDVLLEPECVDFMSGEPWRGPDGVAAALLSQRAAVLIGLESTEKDEGRVVGRWQYLVHDWSSGRSCTPERAEATLYICGSLRSESARQGVFLSVNAWECSRPETPLYRFLAVEAVMRLREVMDCAPQGAGAPMTYKLRLTSHSCVLQRGFSPKRLEREVQRYLSAVPVIPGLRLELRGEAVF